MKFQRQPLSMTTKACQSVIQNLQKRTDIILRTEMIVRCYRISFQSTGEEIKQLCFPVRRQKVIQILACLLCAQSRARLHTLKEQWLSFQSKTQLLHSNKFIRKYHVAMKNIPFTSNTGKVDISEKIAGIQPSRKILLNDGISSRICKLKLNIAVKI